MQYFTFLNFKYIRNSVILKLKRIKFYKLILKLLIQSKFKLGKI
jgi:hypothetical protein